MICSLQSVNVLYLLFDWLKLKLTSISFGNGLGLQLRIAGLPGPAAVYLESLLSELEVFKMFKGFDIINLNDYFKLSSTRLRGHILKIYKPQVHLDVSKFFFTVRIIDVWNIIN